MWVEALIEKKFCVGNPVVIVKVLDWVLMDVPSTVATTQTGVGTVPELTETVTYPEASDVDEVEDNATPPGALEGIRVKSTSTPALPLLLISNTWNFTSEV